MIFAATSTTRLPPQVASRASFDDSLGKGKAIAFDVASETSSFALPHDDTQPEVVKKNKE